MWVCHRGGFTAARKLHSTADEPATPMTNGPSPRTRVELLSTGETLDVDDDDLEKVIFFLAMLKINRLVVQILNL